MSYLQSLKLIDVTGLHKAMGLILKSNNSECGARVKACIETVQKRGGGKGNHNPSALGKLH